ncbi:MAG: PLP-dependent aminotransferase family protein [Acidobacteriota bacterium]
MESDFVDAARRALESPSDRPRYVSLADALAGRLEIESAHSLPSARALAVRLGLNRATVTSAYRELARRGLVVLRPGRRGRQRTGVPVVHSDVDEPRGDAVDLARYSPDAGLLPTGGVLRWLGLGDGEGEAVAQYGDAWGYGPLREWLRDRLGAWGIETADVLLTAGVQHGLDLLLRAVARPGDTVLVEDPTYPGLPPLLAMHQLRAAGLPVYPDGVSPDEARSLVRKVRPRLAILTPTLHNPTGGVMAESRRREILAALSDSGALVVEELFEPGLVIDGAVPPPLAALDPGVVAVGSFSKALFPGLRVGWLVGPREVVERVAAVKRAADLSGSSFLEATALGLVRRGELESQLARLRVAAGTRLEIVLEELAAAPPGVRWKAPRGGFSMMVALAPGQSSRAVAARAAELGAWVLAGPSMSVTGRDDVLRLAYAAASGERLRAGVAKVVEVLLRQRTSAPLV